MPKKILYVDDNVVMLDLIRTLLEGAGYSVLTAEDATKALQLAEGTSLAMVILDINIAGDSGLMLMNFMMHNHAGVPVVLYTGGIHNQAAVDKMLQLGATKYVTKRNGKEIVEVARQMVPFA